MPTIGSTPPPPPPPAPKPADKPTPIQAAANAAAALVNNVANAVTTKIKDTFHPADVAGPVPPPPPSGSGAAQEAQQLHQALAFKGIPPSPDLDTICKILDGKTPHQLHDLRDAYRSQFNRELDTDLRSGAMGLLTGKLLGGARGVAGLLMGKSPAASDLGQAVAEAGWGSNHARGTVPDSELYTSKNHFDGVYRDAHEIFPAMADSIASAKHEVMLETFERDPSSFSKSDAGWKNDPTMVLVDGIERLQTRLQTEQASGQKPEIPVKVYIAVDGPARGSADGNWSIDKCRNLERQLAAAGIDPKLVEIHVGAHERKAEWGALHSKMLVVDGYKTMVTGANPQRFQDFRNEWHDSAYAVRGEAGIAMARNFDDTWKQTEEITSIDLTKLDGHASVKTEAGDVIEHSAAALHPDLDADPLLKDAELPVFAATHREMQVGLNNPVGADSPQDQVWLAMLANAKGTVKIESPNLNDDHVKQAIIDAVNRGVNVQLVLSLGFNSDAERHPTTIPVLNKTVNVAGGSNEDTVLDLYSKIKDPAARKRLGLEWNSADGQRPTYVQEAGASHTKFMSADGQVLMVGSGNQDRLSWDLIRETGLCVDSKDATREADAKIFDPDFARGIDSVQYARDIISGKVKAPDFLVRLTGDPVAWAQKIVAAYDGPAR